PSPASRTTRSNSSGSNPNGPLLPIADLLKPSSATLSLVPSVPAGAEPRNGKPNQMPVTRAELLAAVERSPAAAHAHDRAGWIALFTDDACVEYPVGSTPHCGRRGIERYYDTFIGPRDVTFHPDVDVVAAPTVIRDLELEVTMPPGLVLRIPAYLRYDLRPERGELKITRLQAYWE